MDYHSVRFQVLVVVLLSVIVGGIGGFLLFDITSSSTDSQGVYDESVDGVVTLYNSGEFTESQGSGFIIEDGYIVTNEHTVTGTESLYIKYNDGSWNEAFVVGEDRYTDIAVLNTTEEHPDSVQSLEFADEYRVGDEVVVIGSPSSFEKSMTTGVISGVERAIQGQDNYNIPNMVQVDAALNPGNSGGPILNHSGEVVGVAQSTHGENLGFGVSAELTEFVVESLLDDFNHQHPLVGIQTLDITPFVAEDIDVEPESGVLVTGTMDDTPADGLFNETVLDEESGEIVETGDIIVDIEGEEVRTNRDVSSIVMTNYTAGDEIDIGVLRDGEYTTVTLTLSERP